MIPTRSSIFALAIASASVGCAAFQGVGPATGTTSSGFPEANEMLGPVALDWARKERFDERVVRAYVYDSGWNHGANGRRSTAVIVVTAKADRSKCYEHWGRLVDGTAAGPHIEPDRHAEVTCSSVDQLLPSHGAIDPAGPSADSPR